MKVYLRDYEDDSIGRDERELMLVRQGVVVSLIRVARAAKAFHDECCGTSVRFVIANELTAALSDIEDSAHG